MRRSLTSPRVASLAQELSPTRAPASRRGRALAMLVVAALLVHAALLGSVEWTWPARPRVPALQVRTLAGPTPPQHPDADASFSARAPESTSLAQPTNVSLAAGMARAPPKRAAALPTRPAEPLALPAALPARVADAVAASPLPPKESVPLYRTRIPPAAILGYALRRGSAFGTAEIRWRPTAEGYAMRFEGSIGGSVILEQASEGGFDTAGLAPARYTDRRQRRLLATNFQRDAGRISFSGASASHPLASGVQDRLSWLLQLAAVASAEPERLAPGGTIAIPMVGVRGAPEVWVLRSAGADEVSTDSGSIPTVKLIRESQGLYDIGVEIWLDPLRHCLPVRLLLRYAGETPELELVLRQLEVEG